jgi:Fe-S-cluster containining protein
MEPYAPCDACAAPCCRTREVVLDGYDAYRIANTLKLPLGDFVELRFLERPTAQYRILLSGARDAEARFYSMVLRKLPDPDPNYKYRCLFLVSVGARGRCGVHPVRPAPCALFPTVLHKGLVHIDGDKGLCPDGAWRVDGIDVPLMRARHLESRRHASLYDAVVAGWNERVRFDREGFRAGDWFHYLHNVYRELEWREPSLLGDGGGVSAGDSERAVDEILRALGWRTDETVRFDRALAVGARP